MRTIVDLPVEQITALSDLCKIQGISRAEAVRRALAKMIDEAKPDDIDKSFGAWKHKDIQTDDHIRQLREEWD